MNSHDSLWSGIAHENCLFMSMVHELKLMAPYMNVHELYIVSSQSFLLLVAVS